MNCQYKNCSNTHLNWGGREMPSRPQCLYYAAIIVTHQVNKVSLTRHTPMVVNCIWSYLSPIPVGWVLEQVLYGQFIKLSQRESGYAKLDLLGLGREDWSCCTRSVGSWICSIFLWKDILWFVHKTVDYHHEVNKFVSNNHC